MVKQEEQRLLSAVRNDIQQAFGGQLSAEDYTSLDGDTVTIVSCANGLMEGVAAHATLGMCLHQTPSLVPGEKVAYEFIGVENAEDDVVRNILSSCAYGVMDGMPMQIFSCWSDLLPLYMPESRMKHILFLPAYLWGNKLLASKFADVTVFYSLVCPLSDGEADYILQFHDNSVGAENLIKEMEKRESYIFDFNREPIF